MGEQDSSPTLEPQFCPHVGPLPRLEEEPLGPQWRRSPAPLGQGRQGRPGRGLWDPRRSTQVSPGVGPGLGLPLDYYKQGLSFCLAQMGSDRAGGCLTFKEDMWPRGHGSPKLVPVPSEGRNMFELLPAPGILSYLPLLPLSLPLHCQGRDTPGPTGPGSRPSSLITPAPTKLSSPFPLISLTPCWVLFWALVLLMDKTLSCRRAISVPPTVLNPAQALSRHLLGQIPPDLVWSGASGPGGRLRLRLVGEPEGHLRSIAPVMDPLYLREETSSGFTTGLLCDLRQDPVPLWALIYKGLDL